MKKILSLVLSLTLILGLAAFAAAEGAGFTETTGEVQNGDRAVPFTICLPEGEGPFPLVVINHGHGGSREENGGFGGVAKALAAAGIASIRMDFPGCGESAEPFTENYLSNMISDSNACLAYALENYAVDADKLGIMGYSMGGRIAMTILAGDHSYKAAALLAPSVDAGANMALNFTGGKDAYEALLAEANSDKGYADFTTIYGQVQQLSKAWFEEMQASEPLNTVTFTGPALVIYGDKDVVVPETVCLAAADALTAAGAAVEVIVVPEADHGYGFYSDQPDVTALVEGGISGFFAGAFQ